MWYNLLSAQCQRDNRVFLWMTKQPKPYVMTNGGTQSRKVKRHCKAFNTKCFPASLMHVHLLKWKEIQNRWKGKTGILITQKHFNADIPDNSKMSNLFQVSPGQKAILVCQRTHVLEK